MKKYLLLFFHFSALGAGLVGPPIYNPSTGGGGVDATNAALGVISGVNAGTIFYGNGAGLTNVPSSVPGTGLNTLGYLVNNPWTGTPFWWTNSGGMYLVENFQGSTINPYLNIVGTAGGSGALFTYAPFNNQQCLRLYAYPTNTGSYAAIRLSANTTPLTNLFISSSACVMAGGDQTNIATTFGVANNVAVNTSPTDTIRWFGYYLWSPYWIADCCANSVHTYQTSNIPCTNFTVALSISMTNGGPAIFWANGVQCCSISSNIPQPASRTVYPMVTICSMSAAGSTNPEYISLKDLSILVNKP